MSHIFKLTSYVKLKHLIIIIIIISDLYILFKNFHITIVTQETTEKSLDIEKLSNSHTKIPIAPIFTIFI